MQSIQEEPNIGEEENPQRSASIKQRNQQRGEFLLSRLFLFLPFL